MAFTFYMINIWTKTKHFLIFVYFFGETYVNKYIIYHSDPPSIEQIPLEIVNESSTVSLNRKISSNPLSNVSWYRGTRLLKTETFVKTATYIIERAMCTDTHNFTLQVNNGVGNVSVLVELIVNCKFFKSINLLED